VAGQNKKKIQLVAGHKINTLVSKTNRLMQNKQEATTTSHTWPNKKRNTWPTGVLIRACSRASEKFLRNLFDIFVEKPQKSIGSSSVPRQPQFN